MDDSFHVPEVREKVESKRAADEFALATAKDQAKLAMIAAKKKAEADGIPFDEDEFMSNFTSSRRKAKEDFRSALQDSKNRVRPEDRARLSASAAAKDQAKLSKIMAIRRAEADSEPIPNEDLAVSVGEELKKKKLLEATQTSKTNKQPMNKKEVTASLVAKDQARLAQIAVTRQIELEQEEIKLQKNKLKEEEERKLALVEAAAKKKLAKQAELEQKTRSVLKDQMRLSLIAAKRKAEEEGLPFNEAEFTLNLVMAKRKQFEEERQSLGKLQKEVAESLLDSLNSKSLLSSPERGTSTPSSSLPSTPLTATATATSDNIVMTSDSHSHSPGVTTTTTTTTTETIATTSILGSESLTTTLAERQAKVLSKKESKKVEDQKESDVRFADVMKVNEQAEETRTMVVKMNQRKIDQENQEKERLEREKKRRERAKLEEKERQASFELMNKTAEQTRLDVVATQKRLEQPSPAILAKQEERKRLIANAKAKAAQEKKLRSEALHSTTTTTVSSSNNITTIGRVLASPNRTKPNGTGAVEPDLLPIKMSKSEDNQSFLGNTSNGSGSSGTTSITASTTSSDNTSSTSSAKRSVSGSVSEAATAVSSPSSSSSFNPSTTSPSSIERSSSSGNASHLGLPKDFARRAAISKAKQFPVIRRMDIEDEDDVEDNSEHMTTTTSQPIPASEESVLGDDVDDLDASVSCLSIGTAGKDSQADDEEGEIDGEEEEEEQDDQDERSTSNMADKAEDPDQEEDGEKEDVEEDDEDDQVATVTSDGNEAAEEGEEGEKGEDEAEATEADTEADADTGNPDEAEVGDAEDLEEDDESFRNRPPKANLGFWESLFLCTSESNPRPSSHPANELS